MPKRMMSLLLVLCMMLSLLPTTAFAAENPVPEQESTQTSGNDLWQWESCNGGVVLTGYLGANTDVYVPGKVEKDGMEYPVVKLGDELFADNDGLNSVTLGVGVSEIGAKAFYDCDNLVCIVTNDQLTTIGAQAFDGCDNFNSIILYDTVIDIGANAFANCPKVTVWCNEGSAGYEYALTSGVRFERLNAQDIPWTVKFNGATYYISNGSARLMSAEKAERIVIPSHVNGYPVSSISQGALSNVYGIVEVFLPDTIVSIPEGFVVYSNHIIFCGKDSAVFRYAQEHNIHVIPTKSNDIPNVVVKDGFTFYVNNDFALLKAYEGTQSVVEVPAEINDVPVKKVLPNAICGDEIIELILPDCIDYMYSKSVSCKKLTTVNIPQNVTDLPTHLFWACYSLKNVNLHNNIKRIGESALSYENQITEFVLPPSVEYLSYLALRGIQVEEVTYPINAVVEDGAFINEHLQRIYVPAETVNFNPKAFELPSPLIYVTEGTQAHQACEEYGLTYTLQGQSGFAPYEYVDDVGVYRVFGDRAIFVRAGAASGECTIPEQVGGVPVTMILPYAFEYNEWLTKLVIPDTVTNIGEGAFSNCINLESVQLPSSLKVIQPYTFAETPALKELTLPENLETISERAFSGSGIESVEFPASLREIGEFAFTRSGLLSVECPDLEYGTHAFDGCESLVEVTIKYGVKRLPERIFMNCINLEVVHMPNLTVDIHEYAFTFCPKVIFSSSMGSVSGTYLGDFIEQTGRSWISSSWVDDLEPTELTIDGITYYLTVNYSNHGYTAAVLRCDESVSGHVTLPKWIEYGGRNFRVNRIADNAFAYSAITSIDIPRSVECIGDSAFQGSALQEIELPETVRYLGVNMFCATQLKEFTFPTSCEMNFGAFASTQTLENVTIPEGVKVIPEWAFVYNQNLKNIVLPQSLEYIGTHAIYNMDCKMTELTIPGNTMLEENAIYGVVSLEKVIIEEGMTSLAKNFVGCDKLSLVYLPESLSYIDYEAFNDCPNAVFCVYKDSYAHTYCQRRSLPYFVLHQAENPEVDYGTGLTGLVRYTDGTPAAGVSVDILYDDGTVKETVTTDETGSYTFTYAEVGQYTIRATDAVGNTASGQVAVRRMNAFDVYLSGDTSLTLKQSWSVSGTVSEPADVMLMDEQGNVFATLDNVDEFSITNVPNGSYVLKAEGENGSVTREITVFNANVTGIVLTLPQAAQTVTLHGYVEVEDREQKRHRRNWVEVSVYNADGTMVAECKSDKDGSYRFAGLPVGEYTIMAQASELRPDKKNGKDRSVTLTGYGYINTELPGTYEVETIVLYEETGRSATISGKVTSNGETQDCEVVLRNVFRHEVAKLTTGKNGKYSFKNVPDGLYFITARTKSDGMGMRVVIVRDGEVFGETDIKVAKGDAIKRREETFFQRIPYCADRNAALAYKDVIAAEKDWYDGLSKKEKKQLSEDYVTRLEKLCGWLAQCEYSVPEGVSMGQGGLVVSGEELVTEKSIQFNLIVEKTEAWQANENGVQSAQDHLYYQVSDAAGDREVKQYYEISMTRTVDGEEQVITSITKDTDTTGTFLITLPIPEEYRGYKHYSVIHIHNGVPVMLTDLDTDPDTITIEVNGFSTFALTATNVELIETLEDEEPVLHKVTVGTPSNGEILVDKSEGEKGTVITVTAIPADGYKLKTIYVDGVAISGKTFTITGDHTVTAVFEKKVQSLFGYFSLDVVNTITVNGEQVDICRWKWTPAEA